MTTEVQPGADVDALVAEMVMGWRLSDPKDGRGSVWLDEKGEFVRWQPRAKLPFDWDLPYFEPSKNIDAAWEVADELRSRFGIVEVHGHDDPESPGAVDEDSDVTFWTCVIGLHGEIHASAGTAPLAICRAALKALKKG